MPKQAIVAALEEVFGEYVLNISKDDLKIAALRGKIALENVQLDGDMIGGHILGAFGLTGFGVLSCAAKSVQISVPWKNLEKETTRFEIRGIHLVCVPLIASTANNLYGAGTRQDPLCSLRTRAKRLALSRLERNFWNGLIPGEGPPMKRISRAVKEVEKELRKSQKRRLSRDKKVMENGSDFDDAMDSLVDDLQSTSVRTEESEELQMDQLPELPRDWKVKLREKILRNMEASIFDTHIRCEVPQKADSDDRAFACGFTLDSFTVRTANEKWQAGSHDKKNEVDGSPMSSAQGHLGPNEYVVKNNKIVYFKNLSLYWDDQPPLLLAETEVLQGNSKKLSSDKVISRVATAMETMSTQQDPGHVVRSSLSATRQAKNNSESVPHIPHQYICKGFDSEIRSRCSDRTQPGPISCSADVLPCEFNFDILPEQFAQYQKLRADMKAQQRFDTMFRQRPSRSAVEDPRAWWKYAFACVISRPNSRPWGDIQIICRSRSRYIELISKKSTKANGNNGFHSGLSEAESSELLALESLLPIESLLAFHLLALRKAYRQQEKGADQGVSKEKASVAKSLSPFRLLRPRSSKREKTESATKVDSSMRSSDTGERSQRSFRGLSLFDAMTLRLGKKMWFVDWRLHDATVNIAIHNTVHQEHSLRLAIRTSGRSRVFGLGKRDFFFDINQCDLNHGEDKVLFTRFVEGAIEERDDEDLDDFFESDGALSTLAYCDKTQGAVLDLDTSASFLELPPLGTLCRIAAGRTKDLLKVSVSAHPLTLVWTSSLFDCISEFVGRSDPGLKIELADHIRNATPLARKAQLAFLSPASSALHINVAAPKVWIPVVSNDSEGALFVDAGNMKFSSRKDEGKVESDWDVSAYDLQVNFVRSYSVSRLQHEAHYLDTIYKAETSVIKPFSVEAHSKIWDEAASLDDQMAKKGVAFTGQVRCLEAAVSPICLSLVDAEVLARSFGKIYTRGIGQLQRRDGDEPNNSRCLRREEDRKIELLVRSGIPRRLNMNIEKIEIAIEGHSKRRSPLAMDDKSNISMDDSTLYDVAPPVRIYLVEIFRICVERSIIEEIETAKLSLFDASIIRLREGSFYTPLRVDRELVESENCILQRSHRHPDIVNDTHEGDSHLPVLSVSFLRDKVAHLDEIEIELNFITMRVTPTTLKDCTKAFRKIVELVQLATKEMERKVHEAGRKARRDKFARDLQPHPGSPALTERPLSPSLSISEDNSMIVTSSGRRDARVASDSSILFKLTLNENTILAGRPTLLYTERTRLVAERRAPYAVIQILSNALIMFQSIENPDGTGNKTLHVSLEDVSSLINTEFESVDRSEAPPMIGPFGTEFRVVYATENLGCVVSQDVSLDCETVKARLTPNDFSIMISILRRMYDRLKDFGSPTNLSDETPLNKSPGPIQTLVRYQKKGTGIATTVRAEIHAFSFVLLRAFKSHAGAPEFLDFNIQHIKVKLEGCMSALSGDCSALLSINSFNSDAEDWEYAVEPFSFLISVEQMPNELSLIASSSGRVHLNLTGVMLRDLAKMKFDILRDTNIANEHDNISHSALSTVGLRRATEARTIRMTNTTGLDLNVQHNLASTDLDLILIKGDSEVILGHVVEGEPSDQRSISVGIASTSAAIVGERQAVLDIPITSSSLSNAFLYILHPSSTAAHGKRTESDIAYYNTEPVVESCIRNERLKPSISDMFGLSKGRDLLSSEVWPLDEENAEGGLFSGVATKEAGGRGRYAEKTGPKSSGNWLKPYLKNDPPVWSDMTGTQGVTRDRFVLPDERWFWADDWNVDLSGKLGLETDSDGWEYEADFETFTRKKRAYRRGDACRRQRWTRTRVLHPLKMNDPLRPLKLMCETSQDELGNHLISIRSHVRIFNKTGTPLSVFLFCPSWEKDELAGTMQAGQYLDVPVILASAIYMRIAKLSGTKAKVEESLSTDRFLILSKSQSSSNFIRTSMDMRDVSGTILHYLLEIKSSAGAVEIRIEPVFRIVNLLPCQLECQVGHSHVAQGKYSITKTETLSVSTGKDGCCTAVDPLRMPHISLRVPGYRWSSWHRIVNRDGKSDTWRPSKKEEDMHFTFQGDSDFANELTTVVMFERIGRIGDPLTLLLSVECGHCPVLRVYSQYLIVDKSGFGCRFSEGFLDILASTPDNQTSRRSYLLPEERDDHDMRKDFMIPGNQWSIGMNGMTLYFSKREKLTMCIEIRNGSTRTDSERFRTKWIAPLDISNVLPKTVFSVEESHGQRLFELAYNVTVCPGVFCRTKIITLLPRYQIVNLLHRELITAQDGSLDNPLVIPSQSTSSFHWENGSLPLKVRLGAPTGEELRQGNYENCWSNGVFQVDRVGITSMRLPATSNLVLSPMVVQAEVRLATKDQPSAVVVVIWSASDKSNPLYILRNRTRYTILCRQPINEHTSKVDDDRDTHQGLAIERCTLGTSIETDFPCGAEFGPAIRSFLGLEKVEEFVWTIESNQETCFGFDNPEKPRVLEWCCVTSKKIGFDNVKSRSYVEIDEMGSSSVFRLPGRQQIRCMIKAEHSTKVVEFVEDNKSPLSPLARGRLNEDMLGTLAEAGVDFAGKTVRMKTEAKEDDEEEVAFGVKLRIPSLLVSVIDNVDPHMHGREILIARAEKFLFSFSQTREGYHELELTIGTFQADNHVRKSIHPILVFCPQVDPKEPLLHMSAVRRIQDSRNTFVFRYVAIRLLEIEIYLDRRTAETVARFIEPITTPNENRVEEADWVAKLTQASEASFSKPDRRVPKDIETMIHLANSGRIYFERLHLHPVRIGLTFTQEWMDWTPGSEGMMLFQFIRGMTSIANAPLVFTSFVVGHVFEAPQTLMRVINTHYASQLTKQIFGILGSLAILGAPADFISNVGSGVRDFFYEPIQGAVHGPRQFIEGLEAGTQSLARGVFVGVVRGVSNVTEAVNTNLAGLTADDDFMDERRAYQRIMTDTMSRGPGHRTFSDSLYLAGASVARSVRSGALGIVEQPGVYASKHGPVGFVKGIGKALIGAVVKPVVGVGDAAVLVMNHISDATSKKTIIPKIPIRMRRALPCRSIEKINCVRLEPFDERAAKAQRIVTGGETLDDVYIGHLDIPNHLIIASEQCLWAIDRRSREPWCVDWEEISHFGSLEGGIRIVIFSQNGVRTYMFQTESSAQSMQLQNLLSMQSRKMANSSELDDAVLSADPDSLSRRTIPGVKARQVDHVFGSFNNSKRKLASNVKDEVDLVEQCRARVRVIGSDSSTYFRSLDEEAWSLVSNWGQVFSGLSSRRCIVASIINGTGGPLQIKSFKLLEGGSPCYSIPTKEFDAEQGILYSGGCIIFFAWGVGPSLLQAGNVFMHIETNSFECELSDHKNRATYAKAMPGYKVGFLEKSYDDGAWWAKYWILARAVN